MRRSIALVVLALCAGCGVAQDVQRVVRMSSEIIVRAEPCLQAQRERDMELCIEGCDPEKDLTCAERARSCVENAKATWAPIIESLGTLRDLRCDVEPEQCP